MPFLLSRDPSDPALYCGGSGGRMLRPVDSFACYQGSSDAALFSPVRLSAQRQRKMIRSLKSTRPQPILHRHPYQNHPSYLTYKSPLSIFNIPTAIWWATHAHLDRAIIHISVYTIMYHRYSSSSSNEEEDGVYLWYIIVYTTQEQCVSGVY